ncbi:MAG TPA: hypothetical protein VD788_02025 [Candidatus Polarisedimenticolaceae bacterium]|nr:hypothetical protein [Candidatus Polarisedimenticolaceae bacterium]
MRDSTKQTPVWARTLDTIAARIEQAPAARKRDLDPGDRVIVATRNSVYCLQALGGDLFEVSGGWFERNPDSRLITVNGCTYGGLAIHTDIVAARGLFLEFGNNVSTTRIQRVLVVRGNRQSAAAGHSNLPN